MEKAQRFKYDEKRSLQNAGTGWLYDPGALSEWYPHPIALIDSSRLGPPIHYQVERLRAAKKSPAFRRNSFVRGDGGFRRISPVRGTDHRAVVFSDLDGPGRRLF